MNQNTEKGSAASVQAKPVLPGNSLFFQNSNAKKLIVFIHGIKGHPKTTWTNEGEKFFWPKELAKDDKFKNANVLSFGYESHCGPSANIREIAQQLYNSLEVALEETYQSISFVAHSMGGLVVREFVLSHLQKFSVPLDSLVMLSTPNGGNQLANFAKYFCDGSSLKDLEAGKDGYIDGLNDRWREKFEQPDSIKPFLFSAGYELLPVRIIGPIVDKVSATLFSHQISAFKKNHSTIAKPLGVNDSVYSWVKQRLLKKPLDPDDKASSDEEEKQYTETIEKLQQELQGTDLEKALQLIEENQLDKALALLSEREMKEDEEIEKIARTRYAKAQVYKLKLDHSNALKYYKKAVQLAPNNALYLNDAGLMLATLAQYDKAIEYYELALASGLKTFGSDHPQVAIYRNNLGVAWKAKGEYDKAIEYFELALTSGLKTFGSDHPQVAIYRNSLGVAWKAKGEYDKAIEYYELALATFENANLTDYAKLVRKNISLLKNQR